MSEMVERVAEALAKSDKYTSDYTALARAAIEAMREPTEGMTNAAFNIELWDQPINEHCAQDVWQTMIDAALQEPTPSPTRK